MSDQRAGDGQPERADGVPEWLRVFVKGECLMGSDAACANVVLGIGGDGEEQLRRGDMSSDEGDMCLLAIAQGVHLMSGRREILRACIAQSCS